MDDSLETTTGKINALWQKSDDHQATLGVMMAHAKELVEAGDAFANGMPWKAYVAVRFKKKNGESRSLRSVQQLLQIGNAPDPQAKAEEIRAAGQANMVRQRAERSAPSGSSFDPTARSTDHICECKICGRRMT